MTPLLVMQKRALDVNPLNHWARFQEDNPGLATVARLGGMVMPGVGGVMHGADALNDFRQGNWGSGLANAGLAGLGLLPGGGLVGSGIKWLGSGLGRVLGGAGKAMVRGTGRVLTKGPGAAERLKGFQAARQARLAAGPQPPPVPAAPTPHGGLADAWKNYNKAPAPTPSMRPTLGEGTARYDMGRSVHRTAGSWGNQLQEGIKSITPGAAHIGAYVGLPLAGQAADSYMQGDKYGMKPPPWRPQQQEDQGMEHQASWLPKENVLAAGLAKQAAAAQEELFVKWAATQVRKHHPEWQKLAEHQKDAIMKGLGDFFAKQVAPRVGDAWKGFTGAMKPVSNWAAMKGHGAATALGADPERAIAIGKGVRSAMPGVVAGLGGEVGSRVLTGQGLLGHAGNLVGGVGDAASGILHGVNSLTGGAARPSEKDPTRKTAAARMPKKLAKLAKALR